MTIEKRIFCDYEYCHNTHPATDFMPEGWVYMSMRRHPFGQPKEVHFCRIGHALLHESSIEADERRLEADENVEVSA